MSLEVKMERLATIIEQTLGDEGSVSKALDEIKADLKDSAKVTADHNVRLDRLEQVQKARSKLLWTGTTAWVGILVAWLWDALSRR